jgi:hypothetical protein
MDWKPAAFDDTGQARKLFFDLWDELQHMNSTQGILLNLTKLTVYASILVFCKIPGEFHL